VEERSIARRLIVSVLLIQAISAIGFIASVLFHEQHARFQAFDIMLRGHADSILGAVQDADDEADNITLDRKNLQVPAKDVYEVQDGTGPVLGRSPNWMGRTPSGLNEAHNGEILGTKIAGVTYRLICLDGVRVVDPGRANGGTFHTVRVFYGSQTDELWEEIWEAVAFSAGASCLLLLFTGAAVAWVLHRSLFPLRELAAEAEGVSAERWSFQPPENARFTKELAPLALALESAVNRLERSFGQQQHFVSDAAHELKTAVAVVKSSLQLLVMRRRSAEDYDIGARRSLADCERLERIVAEMLTLARLESCSDLAKLTESTDFTRSATIAAEQLQTSAELRNVSIAIRLVEPVQVALSEEECSLLSSNLLMNALMHSGRSGEVEVTVELSEHGWAEFHFRDHGEGIDEATLPHVFDRFYRGDPSRTRVTGGSGLGLAICKAIVQKAGGSIRLESERQIGTVAIVRLPRICSEVDQPSHTTPAAASFSLG